jgi:cytochrome b subunit of formate dehydrogenase
MRLSWVPVLLLLVAGLPSRAADTPGNADCLACHEHQTLVRKDAAGREISLFVDAALFAASSHGSNACISCHADMKEVSHPDKFTAQPVACDACHAGAARSYSNSAHFAARQAGQTNAATCVDCHGHHEMAPTRMASSLLSHDQQPKTCGKCHEQVVATYMQSIHGQALAKGLRDAPACTDCHFDHQITDLRNSSVLKVAEDVCSRCHASARFNARYNLPADRVTTFFASYHGMAAKMGSRKTAKCVSCHGAHNVYPSSDPRSTVNPTNMVNTCRQCHPEANANFVAGKIHPDNTAASATLGGRLSYWIRNIYLLLIAGTVGGMLAHNVLVFRRKFQALRARKQRTVVRMTKSQCVQHLLLFVSFTVLALTGFALVYPESWLRHLMGSSEEFRRLGHRFAAFVMLGLAVYHTAYLALAREGRKLVCDLFPRPKDLWDVIGNLRYLIFPRAPKPAFARFSYGEKVEYWALVWGTIVMGVTGLIIMLKLPLTQYVPRWVVDVAITIHYYEAILAVLAIVVWHFYAVIFDPDVYPLNTSCLDGRMPEHLYHEEHELDRETLAAAEGSADDEGDGAVAGTADAKSEERRQD